MNGTVGPRLEYPEESQEFACFEEGMIRKNGPIVLENEVQSRILQ